MDGVLISQVTGNVSVFLKIFREKNRILIIIAGICAFALGGGALALLHHPPEKASDNQDGKESASGTKIPTKKGTTLKNRRPLSTDPVRTAALEDISRRWDMSRISLKENELSSKQRELAQEALDKLGASDELLEFLDFLGDRNAKSMRDWIVSDGSQKLFSGESAKAARQWLLSVEDTKLKETLCRVAGRTYAGIGFKEYLAGLDNDHFQSALLTGYCETMARTDPEGAILTFKTLRPPKVDLSGVSVITAAFPPTADFSKISATFPDDSKSLARDARSGLLRSWAAADPEAAAKYVIDNPKLAFPAQMGNVVTVWADSDSAAAATWVGALSPGVFRDEGAAALVRHWNSRDPSTAWQYVGEIGDMDRRIATATLVFKEWEKTDSNAATQAWITLFPQN